MARYSDIFRDTETGAPIANALVTVTDYRGQLATLTNDAAGPLDNPFRTGDDGAVVFNAVDGVYNIIYSYGGRVLTRDFGVVVGDLLLAVAPSPANAGKYVALDADGNPVYASGTGADAGLRTDLAATTGMANLGFIASATGAVARTGLAKLRDYTSPLDYGAVGDGVTNDKAALLAAMQSGLPVDGLGKTYAINGTMSPSSLVALRNANLIQTADKTTGNYQTLNLIGLSGFSLENIKIDQGPGVLSIFSDDGTSGLYIGGVDAATYITNFTVNNVRVTGNGCGTGIQIRHAKNFAVSGCSVYDRISGSSPDPTNDSQNGIELVNCANFSLSGCTVSNLKTRLGGVDTLKWTRGFTIVECRDAAITGCVANGADQNFDFSGAYVAGLGYIGNRRLSVTGCESFGAGTYGFKFANVTRDCVVSGCIASNTGRIAFVFSPSAVALPVGLEKYNTQNIDVIGCKVVNVLGTSWVGAGAEGFRVMSNPTYPNYPQGIRFKSCHVADTQDTPTTLIAYNSDAVPLESPTTWQPNYIVNSTADATVASFTANDMGTNAAVVTGNAGISIATGTWTDATFNTELLDPLKLHSTSSNTNRLYVKTTGWYRVDAIVTFASNATGLRAARFKKNGTVIDRTTVTAFGSSAGATSINLNAYEFATAGDYFSVDILQSSGAGLNFNANESRFTIEAR